MKIIIYIVMCLLITMYYGYSQAGSKQEKSNYEKDTLTALQILTDSSVKYALGYACSVSGMPPKGRQAINKLVESKDFEAIKAVLDGSNNTGKIYAIEALLSQASHSKYILTDDTKEKIKGIINQDYLVLRCDGCDFFSIKTIDLFNEKAYMKLLTNNGIQIKNR